MLAGRKSELLYSTSRVSRKLPQLILDFNTAKTEMLESLGQQSCRLTSSLLARLLAVDRQALIHCRELPLDRR